MVLRQPAATGGSAGSKPHQSRQCRSAARRLFGQGGKEDLIHPGADCCAGHRSGGVGCVGSDRTCGSVKGIMADDAKKTASAKTTRLAVFANFFKGYMSVS